jgi:hypothetical protein
VPCVPVSRRAGRAAGGAPAELVSLSVTADISCAGLDLSERELNEALRGLIDLDRSGGLDSRQLNFSRRDDKSIRTTTCQTEIRVDRSLPGRTCGLSFADGGGHDTGTHCTHTRRSPEEG